ncbi:hypothetical protein [Paraflavitalea speifideaquila]|uniref:hypothetical protein n=1 Tax=Paraflavitalea speifideaquila TaxID=3076558 RepID=UPI0028F0CB7D|nr:hypothetical protein [Paraflavitalea speifideiaquila]
MFQSFCLKYQAKPLLIELECGDYIEQPMFNKVVYCENLQEALQTARAVSDEIQTNNWPLKRLKIEIPDYLAGHLQLEPSGHRPYFEWHGKIHGEITASLRELCRLHKVHLSLNALKRAEHFRFITLREYGSAGVFHQRVNSLKAALSDADWPLLKDISEYCVYDNNVNLDNGWLPK